MTKRPTINTLTNTASPTYLTQLNQNFTNVKTQFDNTLSLDGSLPNAMNADLDLNGNDLINGGTLSADDIVIGGTSIGTQVSNAAASATSAATSASSASASATTATAYTPAYFDNFAALKADTRTWPVGQLLNTRAEGFAYQVAASGATDHHVTTAGGTKLYVQAGDAGYNVKQWGAKGDGVTNDAAAIQAAMDGVKAVGGGDLYVPQGTWICSTGLTLRQGVQLYGAGTAHHAFYANPSYAKTGTVLLITGAVGADCINFEPNVRGHFGIKSMSIYDNGSAAIRSICRIAGILNPYLEDVEFSCLNTARGIGLLITNEAAVAPFSGQAITLYGSFRNVMTGNVQDGLEIRNDCNANSFIGGSFGATRYSLRMTGTYAVPVGTFFGGCAFESGYSATNQEIEYIAGAAKIYGWVAQTNAYAIKFVKIEKARGVEFSGCYFENGSTPATYNNGVNGSWPAASVVALDAALQSDVQNVHFTGCSWNSFLLDRGAYNSATGLPFWAARYNSESVVALVRRNTAAQVIPAYVYTTIDFSGNNLIYDETAIAYDPATDTLTFKVAGVFLVSATTQFDGYSVATDYAHLRISSAGVEYYGPNAPKGAGVQDLGMTVTAIISASVGQTLQVAVFHTGSGINQTISGTANRTYLSVAKL
jgi:hypothetical protein